MRLCFVIACMAGIGVGLVHLRNRQDIASHELLSLDPAYKLLRRTADQQESQRGRLTSPRQLADRARRMDIDPDRQPVRLAGPGERRELDNTRGVRN